MPTDQTHLFGTIPAASRPAVVRPFAHAPELAIPLPEDLRMGPSSWSFPGWEGLVYDRRYSRELLSRHGLTALARHPLVRCVGIDATLYRPMPADSFADWAAQVPEDFRFVVKVHDRVTLPVFPEQERYGERRGSKNPDYLDSDYAIEQCLGPFLEGLADRAAALHFQFAPLPGRLYGGAARFADDLGAFLERLPTGPHYVVELRSPSLLTERYAKALGLARHVYLARHGMPPLQAQARVVPPPPGPLTIRWREGAGLNFAKAVARYAPFGVLRDPDPATRDDVATLALRGLARGDAVNIVVSNHAEGSGPVSIVGLGHRIASRLGAR